ASEDGDIADLLGSVGFEECRDDVASVVLVGVAEFDGVDSVVGVVEVAAGGSACASPAIERSGIADAIVSTPRSATSDPSSTATPREGRYGRPCRGTPVSTSQVNRGPCRCLIARRIVC